MVATHFWGTVFGARRARAWGRAKFGAFGVVGDASAPRQFQRLRGNHGTPNDLNPGDTLPDPARARGRGGGRRGGSGGSRTSTAAAAAGVAGAGARARAGGAGSDLDDDATSLETRQLGAAIAAYLTDLALWRPGD